MSCDHKLNSFFGTKSRISKKLIIIYSSEPNATTCQNLCYKILIRNSNLKLATLVDLYAVNKSKNQGKYEKRREKRSKNKGERKEWKKMKIMGKEFGRDQFPLTKPKSV